jgi:hypothetical protein
VERNSRFGSQYSQPIFLCYTSLAKTKSNVTCLNLCRKMPGRELRLKRFDLGDAQLRGLRRCCPNDLQGLNEWRSSKRMA